MNFLLRYFLLKFVVVIMQQRMESREIFNAV